jgi:hypothetical protein
MKSPPSPETVRDILRERLDTLLSECDHVMDNAAYGQIFHDLDDFLLIAGKKFLQELYQEKLQERIQQAEQNAETKQCSHHFSEGEKVKSSFMLTAFLFTPAMTTARRSISSSKSVFLANESAVSLLFLPNGRLANYRDLLWYQRLQR